MKSVVIFYALMALSGALAFIGCVQEPPGILRESTTGEPSDPSPTPPSVTGVPLPDPSVAPSRCDVMSCSASGVTIKGGVSASWFMEAPPALVDVAMGSWEYSVPPDVSTVLVDPHGDTAVVLLPSAESTPGRIIRVKVMGSGWLDIQGTFNPATNSKDTIDGASLFSLEGIAQSKLPAVIVQAYFQSAAESPTGSIRAGWAVLGVSL